MMKVRYWFLILCLFGLNVNSLAESAREIAPPGKFYIDFENGNDANFGTKEKPWKHHPWDMEATGTAASIAGKHTYYLKQGVIYRGSLKAMESGDEANPIQLTVDPLWGTGEAEIYGSERFTGDWKRCTDKETSEIPANGRSKTWYKELKGDYLPKMLYEIRDGRIIKIDIAREPDWEITNPDDPQEGWWEWTRGIMECIVGVEDISGFKEGDSINATGEKRETEAEPILGFAGGGVQILEVGPNWLRLAVEETKTPENVIPEGKVWRKLEIIPGAVITNGKGSTLIKAFARKDNEGLSYLDKSKDWKEFLGKGEMFYNRMQDDVHLTQNDPCYWLGATVWGERESFPNVVCEIVKGYNPEKHELLFSDRSFRKYCRYFIENIPILLDSPNEWYYDKNKHRLYVRLKDDRNPNDSIIEAAKYYIFLDIDGKEHIMVDGLKIRFFNTIDYADEQLSKQHASLNARCLAPVFRIMGESKNIIIANCTIEYAGMGIMIFPYKDGQVLDGFEIRNNIIRNIDDGAIHATAGFNIYYLTIPEKELYVHQLKNCRVKHILITGNKINNCQFRQRTPGAMVGAIAVIGGEIVEISNNVVDYVALAGIEVRSKYFYDVGENTPSRHISFSPFYRTLVYRNIVKNSVINMDDIGGIEAWFYGPTYIYNNISGNAVGVKYAQHKRTQIMDWFRRRCWAPCIYMDHQYKGYVFNNIFWGKNNKVNDPIYNAAGIQEANGFLNYVFNNTIYNVVLGFHKSQTEHNRCYYLNNLVIDSGSMLFLHEPRNSSIEHETLAYGYNLFEGSLSASFGILGGGGGGITCNTLKQWQDMLKEKKAMINDTGESILTKQVVDKESHKFELSENSIAIDSARKIFVPWALYKVTGEWGFYKIYSNPEKIIDESFHYWTDNWKGIRNDLLGIGINEQNYEKGILEDWVDGALKFDGKTQYCYIKDGKGLDMDTNSFLIEVVANVKEGVIVSKMSSGSNKIGYSLTVEADGKINMKLNFGNISCFRKSLNSVNDGKWHHILVEVDREKKSINLFIDGNLSNKDWLGEMDSKESLLNDGDFIVGKFQDNSNFLDGILDYLRISRGTLKDAETTIKELYKWEFDGPFLKDFYGNSVYGKSRDIGAIEFIGQK